MKRYTILFMFMMMTVYVSAQPILYTNRIPEPGDFVTDYIMDTTNVHEGESGENITWNFTGIQVNDSMMFRYVNPAQTPYADKFNTSDIAAEFILDTSISYSYFTDSRDRYNFIGSGSNGVIITYTDPSYVMTYPFNFNSESNDVFKGRHQFQEGFESTIDGNIISKADAYGTIILPNGSSYSALRVKITENYTDTTLMQMLPAMITEVNSVSYQWYTDEFKFPVFNICYKIIKTNWGITYQKLVDFNVSNHITTDVSDGATEKPLNYRLEQNFPNPFNPVTTISFSIPSKEEVSLKVYDLLGREAAVLINGSKPAGRYTITFDASDLASGVYVYKLNTGKFTESRKLLLLR